MFEIFRHKKADGDNTSPPITPTSEVSETFPNVIHEVGVDTLEWLQGVEADRQIKFMRFGSHILAVEVLDLQNGTQTQHDVLHTLALAYEYDREVFTGNSASDAGYLAREFTECSLREVRVERRSNLFGGGDPEQRALTARMLSDALPGLIVTSTGAEL